MKIKVDTVINSTKSNVWNAITDIENCATMISGISGLKILHKPEQGVVGLKWTETRQMFGKECDETMWITDAVEEEYYTTRAENHGAIYISKLSLEAEGEGTKLTMMFSGTAESFFVRLLSAVMSVFVKKSMIKMIQGDLDDIKTYIESQ